MIEQNAGPAVDEGVADRAYYERKIASGQIKIVEGDGQRWQAGRLPNGRCCVLDMGISSQRMPGLAFGLDEQGAVQAVKEANRAGRYHPIMTMR